MTTYYETLKEIDAVDKIIHICVDLCESGRKYPALEHIKEFKSLDEAKDMLDFVKWEYYIYFVAWSENNIYYQYKDGCDGKEAIMSIPRHPCKTIRDHTSYAYCCESDAVSVVDGKLETDWIKDEQS